PCFCFNFNDIKKDFPVMSKNIRIEIRRKGRKAVRQNMTWSQKIIVFGENQFKITSACGIHNCFI
ncbi:MAG: hypothetical protein LBQ01_02720, partial [Prevotellaceae bacterium]|nr:hypothetical protein [Prevotellaceae bacterium]